jgi:hypothetical protein
MPRTKTLTVYSFDELSSEAQEKALERFSDINVYYGWWEFINGDAAKIGLLIEEFDLDRGTIRGKLTKNFLDVCKAIRSNHGKDTETFGTQKEYLSRYIEEFKKWLSKEGEEECYSDCSRVELLEEFEGVWEAEDIVKEFCKSLLEDYRIMLSKEYDYLTSIDEIRSTIKANEYEFLENGQIS